MQIVVASQKQIGEVAELTGLSLRTIRYYEEMGLVAPSARSQGGFRLYSDSDIERLMLVKRMKPLEFSLDQMCEVLRALDEVEDPATEDRQHEALLARLDMFRLAAEERCSSLRTQLEAAEGFAASLTGTIRRQRRSSGQRR